MSTVLIRRTDGRVSRHCVQAGERTTILDALEAIRTGCEPDLAYRHSCHHGSCGTCALLANGARVLACTTRLADLGEEVLLEPLPPFPVVADLAVDPAPLLARMPVGADPLRASEARPEAVPPPEVARFTRFENCIECGLCVSACPVTRPFLGPAVLAACSREIENHPERTQELLAAVAGEDGAAACERALECSRVCPLAVYPARHIADLRRLLDLRRPG